MRTDSGSSRSGVDMLRIVLTPTHLRRTLTIAFLVGSWLTLVNQTDVILQSGWSRPLILKLALNFFTPFVVANLGLLSRTKHDVRGMRNAAQPGVDDQT